MILYNEKYDFLAVYESIKKFYPLGLSAERNELIKQRGQKKIKDLLRRQYPGIEALYEIIVKNIHDGKKFKSTWNPLAEEIEKSSKQTVVGTTYGQAPCLSGLIEIEKTTITDLTRFKELHFFISLVGPYFSIIGVDRSFVEVNRIFVTSQLSVSPEKEYTQIFSVVQTKISEQFPGYSFLPFEVCNYELEGFYAPYSDNEKSCKIFNALFSDAIDMEVKVTGNVSYGAEKWMREDYDPSKEGGWTIYPPNYKQDATN